MLTMADSVFYVCHLLNGVIVFTLDDRYYFYYYVRYYFDYDVRFCNYYQSSDTRCSHLLFQSFKHSFLLVFGFWCLISASQMAAAWVAVVVTYYRFVAVSRPLHARQYITLSRVRLVIVAVWVSVAIIFIPLNFYQMLLPIHFPTISWTAEILSSILQLLITNYLPMTLTMFFNIRLILEANKSRTFLGQQPPSRGNNDNRAANNSLRVTVTMTVIVTVYFICQLPSVIFETIRLIDTRVISFIHNTQRIAFYSLSIETGVCLIVINSLSDCVTYILMGKRCRELIINALSCRRDSGK
jgi:hypothetical protein